MNITDLPFENVIRYLRWSTLEQGNSDRSSEDRQDANTLGFCSRMGWQSTHRLVDMGRSAYTGANLTKGELGKLTKRLLSGALDPAQSVIVVEELDRLSRRPPLDMTAWLTPLLSMGFTVAIANTGQIVTREMLNNDIGGFITLMTQAFSAYDYSRRQSERGNGSWIKRRDMAAQGINLSRHRCRGWLRWDDAIRDYVEIPERVALVREIFRLRLAGHGKQAIATRFNVLAHCDPELKGAPNPFYSPWSSSKVPPKRWTDTAIARIIQDGSVTGYIQYHRNPRGAEKKVPDGDPRKVYPEVIDADTFARANDTRLDEQLRCQGRGRAVSNLIGPLGKCSVCGGTMQPRGSSRIRINKDGSTAQHYPIYCNNAKNTKGAECSNQRGWPYAKVERPLLDRLLTLAIDDQFFSIDDDASVALESAVITIQRHLTDQTASANRLLDLVADGDELAREKYDTIRSWIAATKTELQKAQAELGKAKGRVSPAEHIVRVAEVRERMESDDEDVRYEARSLVKAAFKAIIEKMVFNADNGTVSVHLVAGLGLLIIKPDGSSDHYNLQHPRRDHSAGLSESEAEAVRAFMRRNVA